MVYLTMFVSPISLHHPIKHSQLIRIVNEGGYQWKFDATRKSLRFERAKNKSYFELAIGWSQDKQLQIPISPPIFDEGIKANRIAVKHIEIIFDRDSGA